MPIGLKDWEVAEFLRIVNGATFALVEVYHRSQGQQSATFFYFMYLANSLSTNFESIFTNQINSAAKDSSAAIAGIDNSKVKDTDMGVDGQDTGGHLGRTFDDNIVVGAYEGRVCEDCLDPYLIVNYYLKDEPPQAKHETEHQCDPKNLSLCHIKTT